MDSGALTALGLTLRVALVATILVLPPAALLGYVLARYRFPGRGLLSAAVSLPLVLPPTAVGFMLLWLCGDPGLGGALRWAGLEILFTWRGAVLAAAVMALPLVARTARVTFEGVDPRLEGMARTLGFTPLQVFLRVSLPLAARGLTAAAVLGFTRAMGEFGATMMVAGNIPGRTRTLALAIQSAQQAGRDRDAALLMALALAVGLAALLVSERLLPRARGGRS